MTNRLLALLAAIGLACASILSAPAMAQRGDQDAGWRDVATESDRVRVREWRSAWVEALREARAAGHTGEIESEGVLLHPDSALLRPAPPVGDYRCRVIKVGGQGDLLDYVAYPAFRCRVRPERDGRLSFVKLTGSQRPIGFIYPDDTRRMIFLGTLQLGDERRSLRYGTDDERDMAGIVERIGDRRWRIVFPRPTFESIVDVLELVPVR
jgi:hypothetical protein